MIQVKNLHFTYYRAKEEILKGLNFKVEEGEVFGLLGPSGAGKSTLQKVLLGLEKKYSGTVKVMGIEVAKQDAKYYEKIGVGFELPNLYEQLTVEENLKAFAGLYNHPADWKALLQEVGLLEHRTKKVSQISKGMKMRLNYCRAQIGSPQILFLDEPTSGLDPNHTVIIRRSLENYKKQGKTVVLTTHNMTFAEQVCDRVAFIVDGCIKEIGRPSELKEKYATQEVILMSTNGSYTYPLKGLGSNAEFLRQLQQGEVLRLETKEKSLEEIFTLVTGRVLV